MRKIFLVAFVIPALFGNVVAAHAMAGEHGKGDPKHPISNSTWPEGVMPLANLETRIGGHWINASDWFDYRGDARAFNIFLNGYARVKGATLILEAEGGSLPAAWQSHEYDWEMFAGHGNVSVQFALNGHIPLRDLRIPDEIRVYCDGNQTGEVARFLAQRRVRQQKAKSQRSPGSTVR